MAQSMTVFRSRLVEDVSPEYWTLAAEMLDLASQIDGFVEYKVFIAEDGERLSLVVFETAEAEATWRDHVAHRQAQHRGRDQFYVHYDVSVCEVLRHHHWDRSQDR